MFSYLVSSSSLLSFPFSISLFHLDFDVRGRLSRVRREVARYRPAVTFHPFCIHVRMMFRQSYGSFDGISIRREFPCCAGRDPHWAFRLGQGLAIWLLAHEVGAGSVGQGARSWL